MTSATLIERLGGEKTLSRNIHSDLELADAVRSGISYRAVEYVIETGMLSASEVYDLVGSRRSLTRKKREDRALSAVESDRLTRVARVIGRAEEALGDRDSAYRWLRKPNRALGGRRPLDLLASDVGARAVEQTLGRIEHGVYS
jgi:putative toxin-antitoxin system antitoxin component (TIGR02293 family)